MIDFQIFTHPAALEEAVAAAHWYHERSPIAAKRFVEELFQVFDKILEAPHRWPLGPNGTRKIKLPCFPFVVIYRESEKTIQILAVAHGKRRPGYWNTRL
jgi:plasmid stabilization system protein ParE